MPKGKHEIICYYIGYQPTKTSLNLSGNVSLNLDLDEGVQMEEIVITGTEHTDSRHELNVIGSNTMSIETIKALPSMLGEADVVKAM